MVGKRLPTAIPTVIPTFLQRFKRVPEKTEKADKLADFL